ncbi:MAG: cytochrome ubiquinol oxidase subunit I [Nitrososphaeria archaeon]|nr:cytochrome ubiquinol oxidase subunit I [Conexivisphaerales archaeon]
MVASTTVVAGLLSWAFDVHLPLVYTVLGILWITPFIEYIGGKKMDSRYSDLVKVMLNYLIAVYAIGGVFGTIITVFLAGLMPVFTNLAGIILWPVWATAIVAGVIITIPVIGMYYRTYQRWSYKNHAILGILLAVSASLIPLMFRLVFAYTAYPAGTSIMPDPSSIIGFDLSVNVFKAFMNPLYLPLYASTMSAALAFTGLMMIFGFSFRYKGLPHQDLGISIGKRIAMVFGILYGIFASMYLYEVYENSATMAWSIFGSPPPYLPAALQPVFKPTYVLNSEFYVTVSLAILSFFVLIVLYFKHNRTLGIILGPISVAVLDLAETIDLLAHAPYAVVPPVNVAESLINAYGVQFALTVAKTLQVSTLSTVLDFLAQLMNEMPSLLYLSLTMFAFFNVLLVIVVYLALAWREK